MVVFQVARGQTRQGRGTHSSRATPCWRRRPGIWQSAGARFPCLLQRWWPTTSGRRSRTSCRWPSAAALPDVCGGRVGSIATNGNACNQHLGARSGRAAQGEATMELPAPAGLPRRQARNHTHTHADARTHTISWVGFTWHRRTTNQHPTFDTQCAAHPAGLSKQTL